MTKILAIESATEGCSVAISVNENIKEHYVEAKNEHSRLILPFIEEVLRESNLEFHDLDALAFGRGPGSFTGVRIACSIIQGLAVGLDLKVIPVSTLQALAQSANRLYSLENVYAIIDARMQEIYWGAFSYKDGLMQINGNEHLSKPDNLPIIDNFVAIGSGAKAYAYTLNELGIKISNETLFPHAYDVARIALYEYKNGNLLPPEKAIPVYLRDDVAKKSSK